MTVPLPRFLRTYGITMTERDKLIQKIKDIDLELSNPNMTDEAGRRLSDHEYQTKRFQLIKRKTSLEKSLRFMPRELKEVDPTDAVRVKDSVKDVESAMIIIGLYRALLPNSEMLSGEDLEAFEHARRFIRRSFTQAIHKKETKPTDAFYKRYTGSYESGGGR